MKFRFYGGRKFQAEQAAITALTDNSGGTVSNTIAAITAGAAYAQADAVAMKNAIASEAAKMNVVLTALKNAGITL